MAYETNFSLFLISQKGSFMRLAIRRRRILLVANPSFQQESSPFSTRKNKTYPIEMNVHFMILHEEMKYLLT